MITKLSGHLSLDTLNSNFDALMRQDLSKYAGKWVAVVKQKIVASGTDPKKVYKDAENKCPGEKILIGKIPDRETLVL